MIAAAEEYGILPALLALGAIIIAIFWIIFPFIVISKCNEMIRELKKISSAIATKPPPK
jgi:hypothetical protein